MANERADLNGEQDRDTTGGPAADLGAQPRIVVGVDRSDPALAAMRWAKAEAEIRGAALDLVHAWSWPVPPPISPCSPLLTRTPPDWTSRLSSRPRVTGNPPNAYFATTSATVPTTAMAPMTYLIEPPSSSSVRRG